MNINIHLMEGHHCLRDTGNGRKGMPLPLIRRVQATFLNAPGELQ